MLTKTQKEIYNKCHKELFMAKVALNRAKEAFDEAVDYFDSETTPAKDLKAIEELLKKMYFKAIDMTEFLEISMTILEDADAVDSPKSER